MASGWIAETGARIALLAALAVGCPAPAFSAAPGDTGKPAVPAVPAAAGNAPVPAGPPPVLNVGAAVPAAAPKPADTAKRGAAPAWRFVPPVLTRQDSLFLAAATGEPRFQALRDSSQRILIAEGDATLEYLIARRLTGQTPRQRHYVESLFKAISDSGRNPHPVARLGAALPVAPDSVKAQLLQIGSELGDSAFLKVARIYLESDSVEVRKKAVRSLGTYPSPANAAVLLAGLEKTEGLELAERLWALNRQKGIQDWQRMLPYLKDPNLYNRELARRIVAQSCRDWENVEKLAPAGMDDAELVEWILMADGAPGLSAKIWIRKQVPRLSPARMRFIGSVLRLQ